MRQLYVVGTQLLDVMRAINRAWYTHQDYFFPIPFKLSKKEIKKQSKREQNVDNIITQHDILSKNFMGADT